jgi:hypothetical protein
VDGAGQHRLPIHAVPTKLNISVPQKQLNEPTLPVRTYPVLIGLFGECYVLLRNIFSSVLEIFNMLFY